MGKSGGRKKKGRSTQVSVDNHSSNTNAHANGSLGSPEHFLGGEGFEAIRKYEMAMQDMQLCWGMTPITRMLWRLRGGKRRAQQDLQSRPSPAALGASAVTEAEPEEPYYMGKLGGRKKKGSSNQVSVDNHSSNTSAHANGGVDLDSSIFLKRAHELKEEGNKRFQNKDYVQPRFSRALLRRERAFEAIRKYEMAMQDVQLLLGDDPNHKDALEIARRLRTALGTLQEAQQDLQSRPSPAALGASAVTEAEPEEPYYMGKLGGRKKKGSSNQVSVDNHSSNTSAHANGGVDLDSSIFLKRAHELKEEGNKRFQNRDYVAALKHYDDALKLIPKTHPDRAVFHSNRAACLMQMKPADYDTVIAECNMALQVQPRFSRALLRRARAFEAIRKYEMAMQDVQLLLGDDPNHKDALEIARRLRTALGTLQEAQQDLQSRPSPAALGASAVTEAEPEEPYYMGKSGGRKRRVVRTRAHELKEEGNKRFQNRDYVAALKHYDDALKLIPKTHPDRAVQPRFSRALLRRARAFEAIRKYEMAMQDVQLLLGDDPNHKDALEIARRLRTALGTLQEAQQDLQSRPSPAALGASAVRGAPIAGLGPCLPARPVPKKASSPPGGSVGSPNNKLEKIQMNAAAKNGTDNKAQFPRLVLKPSSGSLKATDNMNKRPLKLVYDHDIRLSQMPVNCSFKVLREIVRKRFPSSKSVLIKYKDNDGDLVTITCTTELRLAESSVDGLIPSEPEADKTSGFGMLRLHIVEVSPEQEPPLPEEEEEKPLESEGAKADEKKEASKEKVRASEDPECKEVEMDDWLSEFAQLFCTHVDIDPDAHIELHEL
ncbi:1-aminocyclopropane-1-carboxylate oxidase-like [Hibiscus syriacus]|uniref:1-aminocyclopropane-1-carboxylate oxidase-like n=1 Tax=Hibiscus syriacus TaxID=106335 RepID=A0A6A3CPY3_HIBSY|nr:1-aminocyclopropane-1-carboxylate oxidase-like [Hibiscus syriacus]